MTTTNVEHADSKRRFEIGDKVRHTDQNWQAIITGYELLDHKVDAWEDDPFAYSTDRDGRCAWFRLEKVYIGICGECEVHLFVNDYLCESCRGSLGC